MEQVFVQRPDALVRVSWRVRLAIRGPRVGGVDTSQQEAAGPRRVAGPLVAGGRYDRLMSVLGSDEPMAAVGFAAWVDRLAAAGEAP